MIDYEAVRKEYPKQKARLTRAINSGNPDKVLEACEAFFEYYETRGWSVPDDWHRWNIAAQDAQLAKRRTSDDW